MDWLLVGGSVCVGAVLIYLLVFGSGSSKDESKVTAKVNTKDLRNAHISIASAGGFDKLCVNDLGCAMIGANMNVVSEFVKSKFILASEPTASQVAQLQCEDNGMECLIMVEIHCIGINYADCCIRWGLYESAKEYVGWPITPGFEFSGKVVKILGQQTSHSLMKFKEGDEVFGVSLFGAYATHIMVPNIQLFHKPSTIDMSEAGGYLVTLFTAYYALFYLAAPTMLPHVAEAIEHKTVTFYESVAMNEMTSDLFEESKSAGNSKVNEQIIGKGNVIDKQSLSKPIKCVLIHSASGGVGSTLVQLCKKIAKFDVVVGVVGGQHKVEFATKMGCDFVVDRKDVKNLCQGNIWDEMNDKIGIMDRYGGFDIIFDANGVATLEKSYQFLKPTGKLVSYGFHTMLPHSGAISPLQWLKLGYNALMTPKFNPMKLVQANKGILGFNLSFLFSRYDILNEIMPNVVPWIEDRKLKPPKVTKYKFEDVASAHRDLQSGKTIGKLVLVTKNSNIDV